MKVIVNSNQTLYVGFRYENTVLNKWLDVLNITQAEAREVRREQIEEMTEKIMKLTGHKCIPPADITHCILYDENKEQLCDVTVELQKGDKHNPERARTYSLTKALWEVFGGDQHKQLRTEVWRAYFGRIPVKSLRVEMAAMTV